MKDSTTPGVIWDLTAGRKVTLAEAAAQLDANARERAQEQAFREYVNALRAVSA